jgi:hypothetical protein
VAGAEGSRDSDRDASVGEGGRMRLKVSTKKRVHIQAATCGWVIDEDGEGSGVGVGEEKMGNLFSRLFSPSLSSSNKMAS